MKITAMEALERVGQRVAYNTENIRQKDRQRRHQTVDLYGYEFTRNGDGGVPADFYISISPDMVYLQRFEFKLIIQPFASTAGSGTQSATVKVNDRSLTIDETTAQTNQPHRHGITPNPHDHTTDAHTHNIIAGMTLIPTTANDFRVVMEGIDITPYLMAQYGGDWIDGQGIYPSTEIGLNYDILEVAGDLIAEERYADADKLVCAGYKNIQITSASPFQCTLVNYLKYNHMSR